MDTSNPTGGAWGADRPDPDQTSELAAMDPTREIPQPEVAGPALTSPSTVTSAAAGPASPAASPAVGPAAMAAEPTRDPAPEPWRRRGPNAAAVVLGLVCMAIAGLTIARETSGYRFDWTALGPGAFVGIGVLLLLLGVVGLARRQG